MRVKGMFVPLITIGSLVVAVSAVGTVAHLRSHQNYLGQMAHHDVSKPLSTLVAKPVFTTVQESKFSSTKEADAPEIKGGGSSKEEARNKSTPKLKGIQAATDAVAQSAMPKGRASAAVQMPSSLKSWDGLAAGQYAPPDTSLDVSPNQILQVTNVQMEAWDKSGNVIMQPKATNSLFVGFGGLCETTNDGDATVAWDRLNQRWVVSQFAITGANGTSIPYLQCVAVSQTSDLLGSWNRYSFQYSVFPDYPKLSVWPGTYYTTFNGFGASGNSFSGAIVCGYDQAAMLANLPAKQACQTYTGDYSILVASVEGSTPPPTGTPAYAVSLGTTSSLNSYRFSVNWSAVPPTLTVTGPNSIAVSTYAQACNGGGTCVTQPNTSNQLDSLGDRLMYRFVYRNLGIVV